MTAEVYKLEITVHKADGLAAKDTSFFGLKTKSDPYAEVRLCPQGRLTKEDGKVFVGKTSPKMKTLSPAWEQTFNLELPADYFTDDAMFEITLMDYDKDAEDDLMGVVPVPIRLVNFGTTTKWYGVPASSADGGEATGRIQCTVIVKKAAQGTKQGGTIMSVELPSTSKKSLTREAQKRLMPKPRRSMASISPLVLGSGAPILASSANSKVEDMIELEITVVQARGLVAMDSNIIGMSTSSDPYVEVRLCPEGPSQMEGKILLGRTHPVMQTLSPTWDRTFKTSTPKNKLTQFAIFELTILDFDETNEDNLMGIVCVPIPYSKSGTTTKWHQVPPSSAEGGLVATGEIECVLTRKRVNQGGGSSSMANTAPRPLYTVTTAAPEPETTPQKPAKPKPKRTRRLSSLSPLRRASSERNILPALAASDALESSDEKETKQNSTPSPLKRISRAGSKLAVGDEAEGGRSNDSARPPLKRTGSAGSIDRRVNSNISQKRGNGLQRNASAGLLRGWDIQNEDSQEGGGIKRNYSFGGINRKSLKGDGLRALVKSGPKKSISADTTRRITLSGQNLKALLMDGGVKKTTSGLGAVDLQLLMDCGAEKTQTEGETNKEKPFRRSKSDPERETNREQPLRRRRSGHNLLQEVGKTKGEKPPRRRKSGHNLVQEAGQTKGKKPIRRRRSGHNLVQEAGKNKGEKPLRRRRSGHNLVQEAGETKGEKPLRRRRFGQEEEESNGKKTLRRGASGRKLVQDKGETNNAKPLRRIMSDPSTLVQAGIETNTQKPLRRHRPGRNLLQEVEDSDGKKPLRRPASGRKLVQEEGGRRRKSSLKTPGKDEDEKRMKRTTSASSMKSGYKSVASTGSFKSSRSSKSVSPKRTGSLTSLKELQIYDTCPHPETLHTVPTRKSGSSLSLQEVDDKSSLLETLHSVQKQKLEPSSLKEPQGHDHSRILDTLQQKIESFKSLKEVIAVKPMGASPAMEPDPALQDKVVLEQ